MYNRVVVYNERHDRNYFINILFTMMIAKRKKMNEMCSTAASSVYVCVCPCQQKSRRTGGRKWHTSELTMHNENGPHMYGFWPK